MLSPLSKLFGLEPSAKSSRKKRKAKSHGKSLGGMEHLEPRLLLSTVDWSTKHVEREGPNLVPNHDFNGTSSYALLNGAVYDANVTRTAGSGSVKLLNEADRVHIKWPFTNFIPVTPGETYTYSAYAKTSSGVDAFPTIRVGVAFRADNGDWLANSTVPSRWGNSQANTWEEMTSFIEVPEQINGTPVGRLELSIFQGDDVDGTSRTVWVDDLYLGLGRGFEQAPTPKTEFDGKQTRVDELGNMEVLKNGTWEPFFPLAIYGDPTRGDWSFYSNQGFNMEMRAATAGTVAEVAQAGMMSGIDVSSFMLSSHANYGDVSLLESRIAELKQQGLMDDVALFYWDNEHAYDQWNVPQAITDAIKSDDVDSSGNRLHPIYSLNGQNGVARRYQNGLVQMSDITGTYIGGDNGNPRGRTNELRVLDNTENQQQPAVIAQINRGVGNEMRPRLFGAIAHGARGMGMWRDYFNHPTEAPVEQLDWWGDFLNISGEIDQMMDEGLIQVPHWTDWSISTPTKGIDFGTRDLNGEGYLIASNYNDSNTTTTFTLDGLGYTATEVRDFFTGNLVATVTGNQFTVTLGANGSGVYRLVDSGGGGASVVIQEDAEDGNTNGWDVFDNSPSGTITNIVDPSNSGNRVINLSGGGTATGYRYTFATPDIENASIEWKMKYSESYVIYVGVQTTLGFRYLQYTSASQDNLGSGTYVHHGLGSGTTDGQWHTIQRSLLDDLQEAQPGNDIISVKNILIRGTGQIDGIKTLTEPSVTQEDAENGNTNGWDVFDNSPAGTITNIVDLSNSGNRVINLSGGGTATGYRYTFATPDTKNNSIEWKMKYSEPYVIYVGVQSTLGFRYLQYTSASQDNLGSGTYVHHGLGSGTTNGQWHTIQRNLLNDLQEAQPGNNILSVKNILIRGTGQIDDIKTLTSAGGGLLAAEASTQQVGKTLDSPSLNNPNGQFELLVGAASAYWMGQGADANKIEGIDIRVADLSGNLLGYAQGSTLWIDSNAAGHGWFLDDTPWDDIEFFGDTGPEGMDLLSVLAHEMGHLLGLGHDDSEEGVMADRLGRGERHLDRDAWIRGNAIYSLFLDLDSDDESDEPWYR